MATWMIRAGSGGVYSNFTNAADDQTEEALVENYDKHQEFYNLLLSHQEVRKDLVHPLANDLYNSMRNKESRQHGTN